MYSIEKNIVKNLAVSEEVANIAMPKPRIARNISTYKRDWAYSPLHFCYRSCEVLANLRGVRSLFTYIKLVFNKCQNLTQAVTRGIIVPVLHPYLNGTSVFRTCSAICGTFRSNRKKLSTLTPMGLSKKLANLFAEFKTLCTFVMRTGALRTYKVHTKTRFWRCPLSASTCVVATSSQNLGATPLFILTLQPFDDKCELVSKALQQGIIVPAQRQNESSYSRILFGKCVLSPYLPERNSTKYHSARMYAATRRLWARLGWNTCILSKPCTRSSRWDLPLQMSRTAITRYSSMPAPSKSANFRIFGSLCSVLA